jgi:serine protease inhibitor
MGTDETNALQQALTADEVAAANGLTRRWFEDRPEIPAVASGLGIWPLLGILATGAIGATRGELLTAAQLTPERAAAIAEALLTAVRASPALNLAFGVWAGSRITLDPEWVDGLPVDAVGSLTGDPAADKSALDAWAARSTQGLIDRMPLDFTERIDLVLASALSVRTTWLTPFQDHRRAFTTGPWAGLGQCRALTATLGGDPLRVHERGSVLTVPGDGDIDVLLGLGRDDLDPHQTMSMLLDAADDTAWGRSATGLAAGERAVGVEIVEYMGMRPQHGPETDVQTVRFKVDSDLDLLENARQLGLILASDKDRAQFDRLAAEPVFVTQAKQTATAEFSAIGFEAAAVTALAMARAAAFAKPHHRHVKAVIRFDRPFAYLARHRPTGLVLVAGWVAEPQRA